MLFGAFDIATVGAFDEAGFVVEGDVDWVCGEVVAGVNTAG